MAWTSNGAASEFQAGIDHLRNIAPGNAYSVGPTLNDQADAAGQSLSQTSDRWDSSAYAASTSPHSVEDPYAFDSDPGGKDGSDGSQSYLPNGSYLGSGNGQSPDTFQQSLSLRYAGNNAQPF